MKLGFERYPGQPFGRQSDTVVYAPYTWAGNYSNSQRLAVIAQKTGFDILAAHAPGTGKVIIDGATRKSLRPGKLHELAEEYAVALQLHLGDYQTRIGWGDSGRGVWIASLAASREARPLTHAQIRDGFTLLPPESAIAGAIRLLRVAKGRGETGPSTDPKYGQSWPDRIYTRAYGVAEMISYADLLCHGTDSEASMRSLASVPDVALHNVTIGHGSIGGPIEDVLNLSEQLRTTRKKAAALAGGWAADYLHTHEPTWGHGNLPDVDGAVGHLLLTAALPGGGSEIRSQAL